MMKTDSFKWEKRGDKIVLTIEFDTKGIDVQQSVTSIRGKDFEDKLSKVCKRLQEVYRVLMDKGFLTRGGSLDLSHVRVPALTINVLL